MAADSFVKPPTDGLRAFGLSLNVDVPPPGAWETRPVGEPSLRIRSVAPRVIAESWSGLDAIGWQAMIDGAPFAVEVGRAGDHRFVHGDGSVHHLSADAAVLRCAPQRDAGLTWWRVVLDSVLFSVALIRGYEALHAGAVVTDDGAVAITAERGAARALC
jgi:hypothetical protein